MLAPLHCATGIRREGLQRDGGDEYIGGDVTASRANGIAYDDCGVYSCPRSWKEGVKLRRFLSLPIATWPLKIATGTASVVSDAVSEAWCRRAHQWLP